MANITTVGTTRRATEWRFSDEPDSDGEYAVWVDNLRSGEDFSTYVTRDEIRDLAHTLLAVIGESPLEATTESTSLTASQARLIARDEATAVVRSYFERAIDTE